MEGKLIKNHYGFEYFLMDEKGETIATLESGKLSIKNCEAIENGYDLDKFVEDNFKGLRDCISDSDIAEFYISLVKTTVTEILGDKKFSLEDMKKVYLNSSKYEWFGDCIQSLQQTEWEVEIVTKPYTEVGEGFNLESKREVKLDADGCLILKRI